MMEWRCLQIADLEDDNLPAQNLTVPGDKLFDSRKKLQHAKSELERYLLRQEEVVMSYASVLAAMGGQAAVGMDDFRDVPVPMQLFPALPSAASTEEEYVKILTDFPSVYRIEIQNDFDEDVNEYQDGKDLQRDCLVLNGQFMAGAEYGYPRIVEETQYFAGTERSAKRILQKLNRTFSGGTAFDHILRCFGSEFVDITPASADAKPLTVAVTERISIGSAHTRYLIFLSNGNKICEIDAHFTFRMLGEEMRTPFLFFEKNLLSETK